MTLRIVLQAAGCATVVLLAGCEEADDESEECLSCHAEVAAAWEDPSSHRLVLDCEICHAELAGEEGAGHRDIPDCATCHSERTHAPAGDCSVCHEPHGSVNAFLLRASISVPGEAAAAVHVTAPEGASVDGLVRAGVDGAQAGTGLCEICHATTTYYRRTGDGAAHETDWCPLCHSHQDGFRP